MHLTYDRLRHTPVTKPWPDSILVTLQDPMVDFMRHVATQSDLFPSADLSRSWSDLISCLSSGKQMIISAVDSVLIVGLDMSFGLERPCPRAKPRSRSLANHCETTHVGVTGGWTNSLGRSRRCT